MDINNKKIAIIGLGYVGLPLAVEFGKIRPVLGIDISRQRIAGLISGNDSTLEVTKEQLNAARHIEYSSDVTRLRECEIFIVTVPTPVDANNRPDLSSIIAASETIGKAMKTGAVVIYESTVYPGCTEEICVPVLEKHSGFKFNKDFFCGYSPERVNPGDKIKTLTNIKKITSGSTPAVAALVDMLYQSIIKAGTWKVNSIKVAEAAKIIENVQRDMNIALVNEFSLIFHKLGIDTTAVLEAAETKWNFLNFRPGLVGGHCIGVDSYYLAHKAQESGYYPEMILSGRRVNNGIANHIADETVRLMLAKNIFLPESRILILGLSFKENCPDIRNTKVIDVMHRFEKYGINVDIYDPWVNIEEVEKEYGLKCLKFDPNHEFYDALVISVGHRQFRELGTEGIKKFAKSNAVIFDVKSILPYGIADARL